MKRRRTGLDPQLQAFVEGRRIGRRALARVHRRALARAEEIVAAGGRPPPRAGRTTASAASRFVGRHRRLGFAFASLAVVLAAGIGAFAAMHRWRVRTPGHASSTAGTAQRAVPPAVPSSSPSSSPPMNEPDETTATAPAIATSSNPGRGGPTPAAAEAELSLLTRAHAAYARRDFATALKLVAEHARLYPDGHLAEQREALHVRSLLGAHRSAEARQATLAFAKRFPNSVLLAPLLEGPGAP